MDFNSCDDDGVDIDLYADVNDPDLASGFGEGDLYDDVVTGTSENSHINDSDTDKNSGATKDTEKDFPKDDGHLERSKSNNTYRILVGNLSWWTTDADLKTVIGETGVRDVSEIKIVDNRANGQSKGYCHVTVASSESLRTLFNMLITKQLHGNYLTVANYSKESIVQFESKSKVRTSSGTSNGYNLPQNNYPRGPPPPRPSQTMLGGINFRQPNNGQPRFLPRCPMPVNNGRHESYAFSGHFSRTPMLRPPPGPPPTMIPPNQGIMRAQRPPMPGYHGPEPFPRGPSVFPHVNSHSANCEWGPNRMPYYNNSAGRNMAMQGIQNQPYSPNLSGNHRVPATAHVNPAFFNPSTPHPPGPPGVTGSPRNSPGPSSQPHVNSPGSLPPPPPPPLSDKITDGDHHSRSNGYSSYGCSQEEYDEIMTRNRTVSSSAISRAVSDATAGEFASAIETLVTAISLIKQSRVARDDRCQVIISSLHDTLLGIENRSYGDGRRIDRRDRERTGRKSRSRERNSRSRERKSRSRDRERKSRSRERHRRASGSSSYHRSRRSSAEHENRENYRSSYYRGRDNRDIFFHD